MIEVYLSLIQDTRTLIRSKKKEDLFSFQCVSKTPSEPLIQITAPPKLSPEKIQNKLIKEEKPKTSAPIEIKNTRTVGSWELYPMPVPSLLSEQEQKRFSKCFKTTHLSVPIHLLSPYDHAPYRFFLDSLARALSRQGVAAHVILSNSFSESIASSSLKLLVAPLTFLHTIQPTLTAHALYPYSSSLTLLGLEELSCYTDFPDQKRLLWNSLKTFILKNLPPSS